MSLAELTLIWYFNGYRLIIPAFTNNAAMGIVARGQNHPPARAAGEQPH
jgi:hypothetical protein